MKYDFMLPDSFGCKVVRASVLEAGATEAMESPCSPLCRSFQDELVGFDNAGPDDLKRCLSGGKKNASQPLFRNFL